MNDDRRPRQRRQRGAGRCDGSGPRGAPRGARGTGSAGQTSVGRTATRTLLAVGAYAARDLRDPDGVARPLLRRAALRLTVCPSRQLRRVGDAYLRSDPPSPDELATAAPALVIDAAPGVPAGAGDAPASRPALPAGTEKPAAPGAGRSVETAV